VFLTEGDQKQVRTGHFGWILGHVRILSHLAPGVSPIRTFLLTYASDLVPKITCQVWSPGLSLASGFEHPASTLPTRFPAALGIGHGSACGLANACALVYIAA